MDATATAPVAVPNSQLVGKLRIPGQTGLLHSFCR